MTDQHHTKAQHPTKAQHLRKSRALRPRRWTVAAALTGALAGSIAISAQAGAAPSGPKPLAGTAKFLGRWNYRMPEPSTGLNIAVVSGTGFSEQFPQIGWVDFTQDADGEVTGTTDQGCAWQFALEAGELQLATQGQRCANKVIGSTYQMNRWTVNVTGNREHEYIQASSFLPNGTFNFTLARGARARVNPASRQDVAGRYAGEWTFSPADPATEVNIESVVSASGQSSEQAVTGSVSITRTGRHSILARTANGCAWKLKVAGNTAELAGTQTCQLPGDSSQTYSFWSMAVRGRHEDAVLAGSDITDGTPSEFLLATGLLAAGKA
jgi:hypothetical protein